MEGNKPGYLDLYHSGELAKRAELLWARLAACDICPHRCGINRLLNQTGYCHAGFLPVISSVCAHNGEEPALSGHRGSGTIFLGNCNMRCVYCQNYQISQDPQGQKTNTASLETLAERMLFLQNGLGCHNINFVSPTHFVPQIVKALLLAIPRGLTLPLVYNSGGYDALETIQALEGIVDVYLPDIRYSSDEAALKYSGVKDYVRHNRASIKEMYRQVGNLKTGEGGLAYRGLIIRHLILPENLASSGRSLRWVARELSPEVTMSVMSQYFPRHKARLYPEISRQINQAEYDSVVEVMEEEGLGNGWLQEMESPVHYLPDFNKEGHPFE
ncbi:MAG TPA: radical SAM protein [Dehalococcoidales bacterium]|nr:radical SAM protein [Dehalococcoidales bacterium]